jgi:CMP-N-acetylneuraminic acid synthetase/spore coat polysaccharide biosynthesis predicted glycosyltransferase SpsG
MAEPESRSLLAIVPARGESRGVPRKNMRTLAGKPLIAHTLDTLREADMADRLVLSSDAPEILRWAELHGYETHRRPAELAAPESTVSEVAAALADEFEWAGDVGAFQPTCPFQSAPTVRGAVERFRASSADSLSSCVREPHLFWLSSPEEGSQPRPLFDERVNRQYANHSVVRETGGIQLVRGLALREGRQLVTARHELFEVPFEEGLDIDTNEDLIAARSRMARGTVVFRICANQRVGSGHLHHCLQLADELADHRLRFLLRECDPFVPELLDKHGYEHRTESDLESDLAALAGPAPNLVVNDVLDTGEEEVLMERAAGFSVVNIEDLGRGTRFADWVVNALYPVSDDGSVSSSSGPKYATLRSEFQSLPQKPIRERAERILITFGGTDPAGLARRCANLLTSDLPEVEVCVVPAPGASTEGFPQEVRVAEQPVSMAGELLEADLALTSAGRSVYEAATTGTPVVVLAANAREATHAHLGYDSGVVFLGIGSLVDDAHIVATIRRLLADASLRRELSDRLRASMDDRGAARIGHRIRALLAGL